ncbi:MAG: hypothetical protein LCH35_13895 [Bacteroidetes bacterium]|uniref:hypothetical protein n=1 Tax=Flavobacterium sp. TaxID=239 RepID=UPI002FDA4A68|nr:hypothetical protein [Bacteroidota bacterium]
MKTSNTTTQKNSNIKMFVLFVVLFLSSSTMFAQETKETVSIVETTTIVSTENTVASTSTEFAIWFVGSTTSTPEAKTSTLSFGKKHLINSGIQTNKILLKKVLKTIVGQESNIA